MYPYDQQPSMQMYKQPPRFSMAVVLSVVVAVLVGGCIGGVIGYYVGMNAFIHSQCMSYPFLLLDPHQYVACKLP